MRIGLLHVGDAALHAHMDCTTMVPGATGATLWRDVLWCGAVRCGALCDVLWCSHIVPGCNRLGVDGDGDVRVGQDRRLRCPCHPGGVLWAHPGVEG